MLEKTARKDSIATLSTFERQCISSRDQTKTYRKFKVTYLVQQNKKRHKNRVYGNPQTLAMTDFSLVCLV
jgi:hypothetical protein